jgi:hypothetical protein|tara:strand:+ start:1456 stop:1602 length:147 start_codon:yes stop_codon:yes gene_type:complete
MMEELFWATLPHLDELKNLEALDFVTKVFLDDLRMNSCGGLLHHRAHC